jgi:hypothetical protein
LDDSVEANGRNLSGGEKRETGIEEKDYEKGLSI